MPYGEADRYGLVLVEVCEQVHQEGTYFYGLQVLRIDVCKWHPLRPVPILS